MYIVPVLGIRIRDSGSDSGIRDPGPLWPLNPGSGTGKKSGSGIRIREKQPGSYFRELKKQFFGLKYLNFLMWIGIQNGKIGSGIKKNRIRDKHPGSATLHCTIKIWSKYEFIFWPWKGRSIIKFIKTFFTGHDIRSKLVLKSRQYLLNQKSQGHLKFWCWPRGCKFWRPISWGLKVRCDNFKFFVENLI